MVPTANLLAIALNILLCFGLPIAGMFWLHFGKHRPLRPLFAGILVFVLSQLVLRMPLLSLLQGFGWFGEMAQNPWLYGLFLGLSAGVFEEVGRWLGFTFLLKKERGWLDGVAFGIGHGGVEAVVLVGFLNVNNLFYAIAINTGMLPLLTAGLPDETAQLITRQLAETPAVDFLLGGVERIFAMVIQIALSILVLRGVRAKNYLWLAGAVLAHLLVDAPLAVLPTVFGLNSYQVEAFIGGMAAIALLFIVLSPRLFRAKQGPAYTA